MNIPFMIDAYEDEEIAPFVEVMDLDTGEFLQNVIWANFENGYYEVYVKRVDEILSREIRKGNIELVYKGE